jgi:hypothetical protein
MENPLSKNAYDVSLCEICSSRVRFLPSCIDICKPFAIPPQDSVTDITHGVRTEFQIPSGRDYERHAEMKKDAGEGRFNSIEESRFNSDSRQGLILAQMVDWSDHPVKVNAHSVATRSRQAGPSRSG